MVTGASGGIGRAISLALAIHHNAHIIALGRDSRRLEQLCSDVRAAGGTASAASIDLAADGAIPSILPHIPSTGLYGLIHSAGVCPLGSVEKTSEDDLEGSWRLNLRAPYLVTAALLPALRKKRGHVLFINSGAGRVAKAGWSAYAMAKHGLKALADALRDEVSSEGIRVTSIFPGRTATDMQAFVRAHEGRPYDPSEWVQPADVAEAAVLALTTPTPSLVEEIVVRPMS